MKTGFFSIHFILLSFSIGVCFGQRTIEVTDSLEKNIKAYSNLFVSKTKASSLTLDALATFTKAKDDRNFFYLDFDIAQAYSTFEVRNRLDYVQNLVLVFSYPYLDNVQLFKVNGNQMTLVDQVGIASLKKPIGRNWKIPFVVQPKQKETYVLVFNKSSSKPLATDLTLFTQTTYGRVSGFQNALIGIYFGLTVLSIVFALFLFFTTRKPLFLLYGVYLVALGVFLGSYLGYTNQIFNPSQLEISRTIYVISIELSILVFVIFAQQLLKAKQYLPKLKRTVEIVIITALLVFRVFLHFFGNSLGNNIFAFFMKLWYVTILFLIIAVLIEVVAYVRHHRKIGSYFALSFFFMILGSVLVIVYQSVGLVKITFYGLSHILFASIIEIVLLSITIALIVGQIYQDRNALANKLVVQQQTFLNAFLQGQEEERRRLGAELHDNVGSRVSNLKRIFSSKHKDKALEKEFDVVCDEIRNMAHAITPSEITMVGLPDAIDSFLEDIDKDHGANIHFNVFQFPEKLDENIATHLFRIVQELTQNVIKHANASLVNVQLFGHEDSITLSFEDDGAGMDPKQKSRGIGLRNIKSRTAQMNGQFILDTSEGKGTSVLVIIPTKNT